MKKTKLTAILLLATTFALALILSACAETFTVRFSGGEGATGTPPDSISATLGEDIVLPQNTFTKTGYTFAGWYDGYSTYVENATYTVKEDVIFNAVWVKEEQSPPPSTGDQTPPATEAGTTPPMTQHECESECETCHKCANKTCNEAACRDKCQGHETTPPETEQPTTPPVTQHECESECETCHKCANKTCNEQACAEKCEGHQTTPPVTEEPTNPPLTNITGQFNGVILHIGATTVGELRLYENGDGYLTISNPNASSSVPFVDCAITYTVADGVLKIWTAPDSKVTVPVTGVIQGRTVSITIESGLGNVYSSYEFSSELSKVTLKNQQGKNETAVWYLPVGYEETITASREGYTLDKVKVDGVEKSASWLNSFTVPDGDITVEYVWKAIEQTGSYTVIYQAGNGTDATYTDHSTSNLYRLLSIYGTEDEPSVLEGFTAPEGKYFAGWLINGTTKAAHAATVTLTEETTVVVAQWAGNITVTLNGLRNANANLESNGWQGNYVQGFKYTFTGSSNFFLPDEVAQFTTVNVVYSDGFVLTGWKCNLDDKIYAPGTQYILTEDVTFTAQWENEPKTTVFEGNYTATINLDLTGWGNYKYVRAEISGRYLTLYIENGDRLDAIRLKITDNTAVGVNALYTFNLTLDGDKLTIVVTRGKVDSKTGEFVRES